MIINESFCVGNALIEEIINKRCDDKHFRVLNSNLQRQALLLLQELGLDLSELGTIFFAEVISSAANILDEDNGIDKILNQYSQFYLNIARFDHEIGIKTFMKVIAVAVSHRTVTPEITDLERSIFAGIEENDDICVKILRLAQALKERCAKEETTLIREMPVK